MYLCVLSVRLFPFQPRFHNLIIMSKTKWINISDLDFVPELQARIDEQPELVTRYVQTLKTYEDMERIPPIHVFRDTTRCWVGDGYLRIAAFRQVGRTQILANISSGTREDALTASIVYNAEREPKLTDAEREWISRTGHVNLSKNTVKPSTKSIDGTLQKPSVSVSSNADKTDEYRYKNWPKNFRKTAAVR